MPLLEINQTRYISASVRLDEATAEQVDQYAAFVHASTHRCRMHGQKRRIDLLGGGLIEPNRSTDVVGLVDFEQCHCILLMGGGIRQSFGGQSFFAPSAAISRARARVRWESRIGDELQAT